MDSRSAESAYSPKGLCLSEALDSTDSIRFSNFQRFELVMNFSEKGFCGFSRTGESVRFPIRHLEVRILPPQPTSPAPGDFALSTAGNARQWRAFANWVSVSGLPNWPLRDRNRR